MGGVVVAGLLFTGTAMADEPVGDGVWSPSHDASLQRAPLCQGPFATLDWLDKNFAAHGRDGQAQLAANLAALQSGDPGKILGQAETSLLQYPIYAVNDTLFHVPATVGDVAALCASPRQ
ncbi:hypothetical protein Ae505Ps2_0023c [Pseudonocardia sp. Ae505_Ps2]|nr:hypothetical protein Ae505Ps2_0023c [Pseudonocardia sp. Ae505_Ps2]